MNMRAVFLHVMADALGSVVVIISALLNIYHEKIGIPKNMVVYIDPTLSLFLVALILFSTIPLGKLNAPFQEFKLFSTFKKLLAISKHARINANLFIYFSL